MRWPPETFLERLCDGLIREGIQLTLASADRPSRSWLDREGFHWLETPPWSGPKPQRVARLVGLWMRAAALDPRMIRRFAVHLSAISDPSRRAARWNRLLPFVGGHWDVIYFPWNNTAAYYAALRELGAPMIVSCRGRQINVVPHAGDKDEVRAAISSVFRDAAAVHCVSNDILDAAARLGLDRAKAVVIRPAVDPTAFTPPPEGDDGLDDRGPFIVVSSGTLLWRKGYEYALSTIRCLVDRGVDVRFEIIGDGPERQRLTFTIADLGLTNHVRLLGQLPSGEVPSHLRGADVFLLSSLSEGIANAALEAMSCGLPVVTTDCGGMKEAITDGEEGYLVPVRDPAAAASALELLARDPALRNRMGRSARLRVIGEFTLTQQVARFVTLLRDTAGSPASERSAMGIARLPGREAVL